MKFLFPFALLFCLLCLSCTSFKSIEISEIESVKFDTEKNTKAIIELKIKLVNENNFPIKIKEGTLEATIGKNVVGKASINKKIKLPKKSETSHTLNIDINALNLILSLPGLIMKDNISIKLSGTVKGKVYFISKKINIEYEKPIRKSND
ncbi:MAG: LEA type 2 family protein [Cytophagaceae bacterium]|nr:LEA type 2 family protein [Cytophagaceae bacterium]MDW8456147.1 LEA type 2 family protein [Cytophagaceae bacterium]